MTGMQITSGPDYGELWVMLGEGGGRATLNHVSLVLFSAPPPFRSSCQYGLLSCAPPQFLCPAAPTQSQCSFPAILPRPSPASLRRCCPPHFSAAVRPPGLAADLPPLLSLLRASAQPRPRPCPRPHGVPSDAASTCQPSCVRDWPPPSGSGLFPTESAPPILPAWILSSLWAPSYFTVLWPLCRPNAPPAAPSLPAVAVPLGAPPLQWSHAPYVHGSEQPPASGPTGAAGPARCAAGVPPPAERWGLYITHTCCVAASFSL